MQSLLHGGCGTALKILSLYVCHRSGQTCVRSLCKQGRLLADGYSPNSDTVIELWSRQQKAAEETEPAAKKARRALAPQRSNASTELDNDSEGA